MLFFCFCCMPKNMELSVRNSLDSIVPFVNRPKCFNGSFPCTAVFPRVYSVVLHSNSHDHLRRRFNGILYAGMNCLLTALFPCSWPFFWIWHALTKKLYYNIITVSNFSIPGVSKPLTGISPSSPPTFAMENTLWTMAAMEMVGTGTLLTIISLAITLNSEHAGIAVVSALIGLIYLGCDLSGAHYNPAVTLTFFLRQRCPTAVSTRYVIVQFVGGIMGALFATFITNKSTSFNVAPGFSLRTALLLELVFTTILCFSILNISLRTGSQLNPVFGGMLIWFSLCRSSTRRNHNCNQHMMSPIFNCLLPTSTSQLYSTKHLSQFLSINFSITLYIPSDIVYSSAAVFLPVFCCTFKRCSNLIALSISLSLYLSRPCHCIFVHHSRNCRCRPVRLLYRRTSKWRCIQSCSRVGIINRRWFFKLSICGFGIGCEYVGSCYGIILILFCESERTLHFFVTFGSSWKRKCEWSNSTSGLIIVVFPSMMTTEFLPNRLSFYPTRSMVLLL